MHPATVYEALFWAMAAIVALSLAGGALLACLRTLAASLVGVLAGALGILVAVLLLARDGELAPQAALLGAASFLFSLVIGTAATLVARKVRRRYFSG